LDTIEGLDLRNTPRTTACQERYRSALSSSSSADPAIPDHGVTWSKFNPGCGYRMCRCVSAESTTRTSPPSPKVGSRPTRFARYLRYADIPMRRTTVKLPDDLDARLRHEAERRGTTVSELTREAIEAHLGGTRRSFLAAGAGASGHSDISERIEEILAVEMPESR